MPNVVLVTGATGFIGRHLCSALLDSGFAVRGTLRSAPPPIADSRIEWIEVGDIGPETHWDQAIKGVEYVVHLAGLAHRVGIREAEIESALYRTNTEGTRRLASAVADSGSIKRLLFVSSVKAISTRPNAADEAEGIDSIYGRSKYLAERAVQACLQGSISDWCILRPCLVYGPGNLGNMDRLLKLVNTGLPLPFGAIHNRRSFLFVSNLTDAIVCCLTNPRAARRTFSVADGAPLSTPDLVRKMAQYTHRSVCLLPVPVSFMKAVAYLGDLAKFFGVNPGWDTYSVDRLCGSLWVEHSEMQSALAWAPRYSTAEGLKLTIESAS